MPRNTAQQLYDVGYVVYGGEREVGGRDRGRGGGGIKEQGCQKNHRQRQRKKGYRRGREELIERGEMKVKCKETGRGGDRFEKRGGRKEGRKKRDSHRQ